MRHNNYQEAKQRYLVQMTEIETDFDQKRIEQKHQQDDDQLSKYSDASLLGLAYQWCREHETAKSSGKNKHINKVYDADEIHDAHMLLQMERDL